MRVDRSTVRFYQGATLVKAHARVLPSKRSTEPSDFLTEKASYALRSIDGVRRCAEAKGEHVGLFAQRLLDGPLPWTKMRQAYALLRLCERYGAERVDALCARALALDVIDTRRIGRMLKTAQASETQTKATGKLVPFPSRFARDASAFVTRRAEKGGER